MPSFEEKSVWVQLGAMVIGLGAYFAVAGTLLANGVREMPAFTAVFMVAVVLMVMLLIAGHVIAALTGRPESADERDRLIACRAEHRSSWIVAVGGLAAVTCMTFSIDNVWTANLLLMSLALSELLGFILRIIYYRRGV